MYSFILFAFFFTACLPTDTFGWEMDEFMIYTWPPQETGEHIDSIAKELADMGFNVVRWPLANLEVCRKHGVAEQTVYRWRNKYGGLETSELQRLRELETENNRLKRIVAQQALDIDVLKEVVSKKW